MSNVFYMPPVTLMGLNAIRLLGDERKRAVRTVLTK